MFTSVIALEENKWVGAFSRAVTLERAIITGAVFILLGFCMIGYIWYIWYMNNFGALKEIGTGVLALTITVMGFQTIFTAFLTSMLKIKYR